MSVRNLLLRLSVAALATACSSADDVGGDTDGGDTDAPAYDGPAGTGRLALTFEMDEAYQEQWDPEEDQARGPFWGTIWNADDVSALGPSDEAEGLEDVFVEEVDLTADGGPTGVLWTSGPLDLATLDDGWVTILGFLDSDGNSTGDDHGPDVKDPVTLPNDNQFQVVEGQITTVNVYFGLLSPS